MVPAKNFPEQVNKKQIHEHSKPVGKIMNPKSSRKCFLWLIISASILLLLTGCSKEPYEKVQNLSPREAVDLANTWKEEKPEITSYVTTQKVVFEFPGGKSQEILLPGEEMLISVAPYETFTHD